MKKSFLFFIAVLLISASQLKAQDYKTALGIRLSSSAPAINNSVSFKHFMNPKLAIEGLFTFDKKAAIGALLEIHNPMPSTEGLQWFYGAGAYIGFDSDKTNTDRALIGVYGRICIDFKFTYLSLNLSLDWKPEINIFDYLNFVAAAVWFIGWFSLGMIKLAETVSE